jgi:hypothetical protein
VHAASNACSQVWLGGESEVSPIPLLEEKLFSNPQALSRGNISANLNGESVFLKKLRGGSEKEMQWLQTINSLGLGVKLYGKTKIQDQIFAVLEQAPGVNTQIPMMAPSEFILKKSAALEMRRQAEVLAQHGIIPVDLQFQVSLDGRQVKIIDPELFRVTDNVDLAMKETQTILNNIFMVWTMESKLEF